MVKVLVLGPPRSGTTWIGQTLGSALDTRYVNEPDGEHQVYALRAKQGATRHAELRVGDVAPRYEELWRGAFAGGAVRRTLRARVAKRWFETASMDDRNATRWGSTPPWRLRVALVLAQPLVADPSALHVVVKSVHGILAADWIADRFDPTVVVVERHPLNAIASWVELGMGGHGPDAQHLGDYANREWGIEPPAEDASVTIRRAFRYAVLAAALRDACTRHADWHVVRHDLVCDDPRTHFRALFDALGLIATDETDAFLRDSDRDGSGYHTQRKAGDLPEQWRTRLSAEQVDEIVSVLQQFPHDLAAFAS